MRKFILTLLLAMSMAFANAQDTIMFKATHYFEGHIEGDSTIWKKPRKFIIKPVIIVTDDFISIKHKRNWFKNDLLLEVNEYDEYIRYVWASHDKNNEFLFVLFLRFRTATHMYFQYEGNIYGYNVVRFEKKK